MPSWPAGTGTCGSSSPAEVIPPPVYRKITCFPKREGDVTIVTSPSLFPFSVSGPISYRKPLADQPFFQPHKSYLVHLAFVARVNTDLRCFVMTNGKNIPIRRELMGKARRAWEDGLFARNRRGG